MVLLEKKSKISKKELRKKVHTSFCSDLAKEIRILGFEIDIILKEMDIKLNNELKNIYSTEKKLEGNHCIEYLIKNPKVKFDIRNDEFALLKIPV